MGRAEPRTFATGFEKVRRSGVAGETAAPGGGLAATLGRLPAGNQVTGSGGAQPLPRAGGAGDQDCPGGLAGPEADGAAGLGESSRGAGVPRRRRRPRGRAGRRRRAARPSSTVSQWLRTCAAGARSVSCSWSSLPASQPIQPGRRRTRSTDTRSPGVICVFGTSLSSRTTHRDRRSARGRRPAPSRRFRRKLALRIGRARPDRSSMCHLTSRMAAIAKATTTITTAPARAQQRVTEQLGAAFLRRAVLRTLLLGHRHRCRG